MMFVVNSKIHLVTKVSLFIVNYKRELRMRVDIRRKRKVKKTTKYRKNKENAEESRGSTKESTRRNKNIGR